MVDVKKVSTFAPAFENESIALCQIGWEKEKDKRISKIFDFFLGGITFLFYLCIRFPSFWRVVEFYERLMDRGQAASGDYSDGYLPEV